VSGSEQPSREELLAVIESQARTIETLTARIVELERQLGRNSRNSSQPPSADGPAVSPSRAARRRAGRNPGKQPGAGGSALFQTSNPNEIFDHLPAAGGGCGGDLADARPAGKVAHLAVGVDVDGRKHALGLWIGEAEGAKFWHDDLTAPDTLDLLGTAPDPQRAARLSRSRIAGALTRARRRDVEAKAARIQTLLRADHLAQPPELVAAYAATTAATVAVIIAFTTQITTLQGQVEAGFGGHPDAGGDLPEPARPR